MGVFAEFGSLLLLQSLVVVGADPLQDGCQESEGWVEYDDRCYYITQNVEEADFTWYEAQNWCMENGGDLISIHTYEETELVYSMAEDVPYNGGVWLGLSQLEDRSTYKWSDGSSSEYEHWMEGHPILDGFHMCAYQLADAPRTFEKEENINAIKGLLNRPQDADGVNTFKFGFTGQIADDPQLCQEKCEEEPRCRVYTYFYNDYPGTGTPDVTWFGECVGRTNNFDDIWEEESHTSSGYEVIGSSLQYDLENETESWYSANCGLRKGFACKKGKNSSEPIEPTPTEPVPGYCPTGFFDVGNKCFMIVEGDEWQFNRALELCQALGADLASINNLEENAAITARIQEHHLGFWLGMYQEDSQWVWRDNSDTSYSNWAADAGSDNHVEMWTRPFGTWHTIPHSHFRGYICQTHKDPNNIIVTPPSTTPTNCPVGWTSYWYACYKLEEQLKTWEQARESCVTGGAELVSIHSPSENAAVGLFAKHDFPIWIGLSKEGGGEYKWSDGWPNVFVNWGADEPGNQGDCVTMDSNGEWEDSTCGTVHYSVCKLTEAIPPTTPAETEGVCVGPDWVPYGSHCYYFHTTTTTNWDQALRSCEQKGGIYHDASLVSIHSATENKFVHEACKDLTSNKVWLGLHKDDHDSPFKWSDGSLVQFERWAPGEPNGEADRPELCVEMFVDNWPGFWNDATWSGSNSYVCKAAKVPEPTTPTFPSGGDGECPSDNWEPFGAHCYLFRQSAEIGWNNAQAACVRAGGENAFLASIQSTVEDEFIHAKMTEGVQPDGKRYWIGLFKIGFGYDLQWVDGTDFVYDYWADGEPNDIDGTENCVEVYRQNRKWNDIWCDHPNSYVCKIAKVPPEDVYTTQEGEVKSTKLPGSGLSSGEIVGIVFGVLALALIVGGIALGYYWYLKRRGPAPSKLDDHQYFSNRTYDDLGDALDVAQPRPQAPDSNGSLSFTDEQGNVIAFA